MKNSTKRTTQDIYTRLAARRDLKTNVVRMTPKTNAEIPTYRLEKRIPKAREQKKYRHITPVN